MEVVQQLNSILHSFKIQADCVDFQKTDNYFFFDLQLFSNTKVKDIQKIGDEISLAIKANSKPSVKILRSEGLVRLEFAIPRTNILRFFDYVSSIKFSYGELNCLLGQGTNGLPVFMDLSKNPHMIISGTTGSGKSTLLHNIIANLLLGNNSIICLLDPKNIEFSIYDNYNIPKINVGYTYMDGITILNSLISVMEERYNLMRKGVNINTLPYAVLIIDEFADLIMQDIDNQFYEKLCLLSQKCRAAKMSIILSTQRPSVNIVNGTIKANFPARISCKTASHVDSKIVLDAVGAEDLMGGGDALLRDNFRYLDRFQVAYTDANEVCKYFGSDNE